MTALATARASRLLPAEPVLSYRRHLDAHGALTDCGSHRELLLAELDESNLTGRRKKADRRRERH